jgi:cell division protease FtsH
MSDKDPKNTQNTQNSGGKKPMTPPQAGQSTPPSAPTPNNKPAQSGKPTNPSSRRPMTPPRTPQNKPDASKLVLGLGVAGGLAALMYLAANSNGPKGPGTAGNTHKGPNLLDKTKNVISGKPASPDKVTFADVAGIDEAKAELEEVVDLIKARSSRQNSFGEKTPKGALLYGAPGCGKTLIAKAIANEAGIPFINAGGSDFVEMYVGVGPKRVREIFAKARKNAPCVLFIDEIDGLISKRSQSISGGDSERNNTVGAFLKEMDGMDELDGVFVIGATNRLELIDEAAQRPGRFDRKVHVPKPDVNGREAILNVHVNAHKKRAGREILADDVDLRTIARGSANFSGADLANLVNEAALSAKKQQKDAIDNNDFENAKDKVMMGNARALSMSDEEKALTAWHEAGHALAILLEPKANPIIKATILPRGGALGMVLHAPEGDTFSKSKAQYKADLVVAAAGRAAEELYYGNDEDITSGAASDIEYMTRVSTAMVKRAGLGGRMRNYSDDLNRETGVSIQFSEATKQKIEQEIDAYIDEAYATALNHLSTHRKALDAIAEALLEHETLTGAQVAEIAVKAGVKLPKREKGGAAARPSQPANTVK